MSAIPILDLDEKYLWAILDDPSGVELAEFLLVDEEQEDGCFRLWPYQVTWFRNDSMFQIDKSARAIGKSVSITLRAMAFPFNYPGQEMLITAPELNHLRPITDKIEHLLATVRLLREMLPARKGGGINHQPQFQAHFSNNARIMSRLPNRDGRGIKGQHPLIIEMDEGQDYPEAGWIELIETMKQYVPGAQWRVHGVSRGVRDRYYKYTLGEDPDMPFFVHAYTAMHRSSWSDSERRNKIASYGGTEEDINYRRNVYGEHGDSSSVLFVIHRLMACVRIAESKWAADYNDDVYTKIKITDELLQSSGAPIEAFVQLPGTHLDEQYFAYWGGLDVGYTRDPSELLVFGEMAHPDKERARKGETLLRLLTRVHMMRISADNQAQVVKQIFEFYGKRLRRFAMDKSGNGLPLWQALDPNAVGTHESLRRTPENISQRIKGYGFSNKVAVEFDDRELKGKERPEDAVIEKNVISFAADELRKLVDTAGIELPYDREVLTEWQGQQIQYVRDEGSANGIKTKMVGGSLHSLDAAFMMVAGRNLMAIEEALRVQTTSAPVLAGFLA